MSNKKGISDIDSTGWEEQFRLFDIKLVNLDDLTELLIRLVFNTLVIFVIVHFMYARNAKERRDFYFSFLSVGFIVFLMCFLLSNVKLQIGFALGLFAIFGILRYRTDAIPIKEMTYLFVVIGISVVNALSNKEVSYSELLLTNSAIIFGLWLLEKILNLKQEFSVVVIYERIENFQTKDEQFILADLSARTGIPVKRYRINRINFLKDSAEIIIFYEVNGKNKLE